MAEQHDAPQHRAPEQHPQHPQHRARLRLVATDLDGTVIRSDGTISARTIAAFSRAEQAGARLVLVTGRPPRGMAEIVEALGHRDGTAICSNGALTYDLRTGEVTPVQLIAPEHLAAAVRNLRAAVPGIGIAVEYPGGPAIDRIFQPIMFDVDNPGPRFDDAALTARPAAKLLGRHPGYSCDDLLAIVGPALDGLVAVTHSSAKGLIEAAAIGVSKATTLAILAAAEGIAPHESIAFGDQPNDLPMLAWAGTSCAVANAHPDVLAVATRVIASNDDDGVAQVLEALFPEPGRSRATT
jgi:HAD superfamily hydrolase (TIGR01484 family)